MVRWLSHGLQVQGWSQPGGDVDAEPWSPQDVLMIRGAGHLAGRESPEYEVTTVRQLMAQPHPPACGGRPPPPAPRSQGRQTHVYSCGGKLHPQPREIAASCPPRQPRGVWARTAAGGRHGQWGQDQGWKHGASRNSLAAASTGQEGGEPQPQTPCPPGCERDRLPFGFCETLRLLGRCQLPTVRAQCCRSCPPPGRTAPSRGHQRATRR